MAFTDHSALFAAVHENGINTTIAHLMRQRPSLFNYATILFTQALRPQLCVPITTPPGGGPLFTVEPQLPVLGAPRPLGLDWCLQLTNVSVDLYPGNTLTLPPELAPIGRQQFALHLRACFGLACPDDRVVENLTAEMEAAVAASIRSAPDDGPGRTAAAVQSVPGTNVICTCLELFGVGHFQGGTIGSDPQQWLKVRLDGLEVVDLVPSSLEDTVECYLRLVLRLGVLPRLIVPMESLVLDITRMLQDNGTAIGQHVTLVPAAVPADVPDNPAVEDDQVKVFFILKVD